MAPRMHNVLHDLVDAGSVLELRKDKWTRAPHGFCVPPHHLQVGADGVGKIRFVDDEQVALGQARTAFAGNFVAPRYVDHLDGEIRQLAAEAGGQVVAAGFEEQQIGLEFLVKLFQSKKIGGDIVADGRVRAAAGFDGMDSLRWQSFMTNKILAVLPGENIVGNRGEAHGPAQFAAELKHQGRLAAADRPTNTDGEGALAEIAVVRRLALMKMSGA